MGFVVLFLVRKNRWFFGSGSITLNLIMTIIMIGLSIQSYTLNSEHK